MSTISHEESSWGQKRMRKGTHSCSECRERKVRCVYSADASTCDDCLRREKTCVDQSRGKAVVSDRDSTKDIRQWLGEIDGTLKEVVRRIDLLPNPSPSIGWQQGSHNHLERLQIELLRSATQAKSSTLNELAFCSTDLEGVSPQLPVHGRAPLMSLVDNVVFQAKRSGGSTSHEKDSSFSPTQAPSAAVKLLRAVVPSSSDFVYVVQASRCAWDVWHGNFPAIADCPARQMEDHHDAIYVERISQLLNTDDMAVLVKILLGLAICVQQLPPNFDLTQTQLNPSLEALQNQYLAAAESVLAADRRLANTIDGLECTLIQSKYYVNMGQPRTAWLVGQRAISTCQVFGVNENKRGMNDMLRLRWKAVSMEFWGRDRQLSLLLGLLYANSSVSPELVDVHGTAEQERAAFWKNLGILAGRVVDRNQDSSKMTFSHTLNIDQEMDSFKQSMPPGWWTYKMDPDLPLRTFEDNCLRKFVFYNARKLLHLPFMLQALSDNRYEYSRDAALESSREMIKIYQVLRDPTRPLLQICNLEDFQVFTAAVVLVINLLGPLRSHQTPNPTAVAEDWTLVQAVAVIFRYLCSERVCSIAKQGGPLLEGFLKARHSFPQTEDGSYHAEIPYFGHITITRRIKSTPYMSAEGGISQLEEERQGQSTQAGESSNFDTNPFFTEVSMTQSMPGDFWATLEDDLHVDWNRFGQQS